MGQKLDSCQGPAYESSLGISKVHEVRRMKIRDGGGGGGGATYIFTVSKIVDVIAGGGGGLGLGQFIDNGHQHGRGPAPPGRQPTSGTVLSSQAGK